MTKSLGKLFKKLLKFNDKLVHTALFKYRQPSAIDHRDGIMKVRW